MDPLEVSSKYSGIKQTETSKTFSAITLNEALQLNKGACNYNVYDGTELRNKQTVIEKIFQKLFMFYLGSCRG